MEEVKKDSCLRGDGSGLPKDSPFRFREPTPTIDLDEISTASAASPEAAASMAVLQHPNYYAHEYRQDRYDYTPGRSYNIQ